jgi:hypothetical protein
VQFVFFFCFPFVVHPSSDVSSEALSNEKAWVGTIRPRKKKMAHKFICCSVPRRAIRALSTVAPTFSCLQECRYCIRHGRRCCTAILQNLLFTETRMLKAVIV